MGINHSAIDFPAGTFSRFNAQDRLNFAQLLDSVTQPIHPIEVFDMIVGTSTGALISFALIGGNYKNGKCLILNNVFT